MSSTNVPWIPQPAAVRGPSQRLPVGHSSRHLRRAYRTPGARRPGPLPSAGACRPSRAVAVRRLPSISQLRDKGIISKRQREGMLLIHPLLVGYESLAHMTNHLKAPDTHVWPTNFPVGDIRPPRVSDGRTGTDFAPDPDAGEDVPLGDVQPSLRLAG